MDRDCNKCVYHTSGSCSAWECKGTVTVEDIRADVIDKIQELKEYAFDLMCGRDNEGFIGKHCMNQHRCSETNCSYKYIELKANNLIEQMQEGKSK